MSQDKKPLVIISHQLPETWLAKLQSHCRIVVGGDPAENSGLTTELEGELRKAEGLLTLLTVPVGERTLERAPRLRVVSNMAVGVDNIDLSACTNRGIAVGHTPGVLTESTADLTMALLLATARLIPQASRDAREGRWSTWVPTGWLGADLDGATLGIVGLGKIGSAVAERAASFGLQILYASPARNPHRWQGARHRLHPRAYLQIAPRQDRRLARPAQLLHAVGLQQLQAIAEIAVPRHDRRRPDAVIGCRPRRPAPAGQHRKPVLKCRRHQNQPVGDRLVHR